MGRRPTTEARLPPGRVDVLPGTVLGVAGEGGTHSLLPPAACWGPAQEARRQACGTQQAEPSRKGSSSATQPPLASLPP